MLVFLVIPASMLSLLCNQHNICSVLGKSKCGPSCRRSVHYKPPLRRFLKRLHLVVRSVCGINLYDCHSRFADQMSWVKPFVVPGAAEGFQRRTNERQCRYASWSDVATKLAPVIGAANNFKIQIDLGVALL